MIVVAIIAILAAVAIPQYQLYVLRAKTAEPSTLLGTMKVAEYTSLAINDCFAAVLPNPPGPPPTVIPGIWSGARVSPARPCPNPIIVWQFEDLSVRPNRNTVNYQYACSATYRIVGAPSDEFSCSAYGDTDGDGLLLEEVYCTDQLRTGRCIPSTQGTVSFFPEDLVRVSQGIF